MSTPGAGEVERLVAASRDLDAAIDEACGVLAAGVAAALSSARDRWVAALAHAGLTGTSVTPVRTATEPDAPVPSPSDAPQMALLACRAYDHWASEIRRLTAAIGECACPREAHDLGADVPAYASGQDSCFSIARKEEFPGTMPDDGPTRRNLDAIAKAVADCPACSLLCTLIRNRKHARQQWGVAKRKVRAIGRRTLTTTVMETV